MDHQDLHPLARSAFAALTDDLAHGHRLHILPVLFRPFQGYRFPADQRQLVAEGRSKAGPFESAHNYGLAVDYVPFINGRWTWEVPTSTWDHLRAAAKARGLLNELHWDRAHVEHPAFKRLWPLLRPLELNAATESERVPRKAS